MLTAKGNLMELAVRNAERTNRHFDRVIGFYDHLHSLAIIVAEYAIDSRIAKINPHRELCELIKKRRTAHLILRPTKIKSAIQLVRRGTSNQRRA